MIRNYSTTKTNLFTVRGILCPVFLSISLLHETPNFPLFHSRTHTLYILYNPHTNTIFSEVVCFCLPVRSLGSQTRLRGHRVSSTVESWQRLLPVVECEEDGMTLTVRRRRAAQLLLDRGDATPSACLCAPVAGFYTCTILQCFFFLLFFKVSLGKPKQFLNISKIKILCRLFVSQRMNHRCLCPSYHHSVVTLFRPHGETSV